MGIFNTMFNFNGKVMKDLSDYNHFVGCDVSKGTLDFAIYERGKDYRGFQHERFSNAKEGFQAMRKWLRSNKIDLKKTVIAMEYTGIYSEALSEWCHKQKIAFVMLHPADVRRADTRGRNKTDKEDSQFIADYIYTQREKLTPSAPEPSIIKTLRNLQNERKLAVNSRTSYKNQIKGVTDKSAVSRMQKMIKIFDEQVKTIEKKMMELVRSDESLSKNYDLLKSIPGIGMINIIATIIATANFTRFQTSRQYAKFVCVSPIARESGTSVRGGNHVTMAGHRQLKGLLTQGARSAIEKDPQMKAYYERKRKEGKSHGCVMNAVKFKLICRMFAVINRQEPYVDIEKYKSKFKKAS